MNRMEWILLVAAMLVSRAVFSVDIERPAESKSLLGLTYRSMHVECKTKTIKNCSEPDPRGLVVELLVPDKYRLDTRRAELAHESYLRVDMFPEKVLPRLEAVGSDQGKRRKYLLVGRYALRLMAWRPDWTEDSLLSDVLKRVAMGQESEYQERDIPGENYISYDSERCVAFKAGKASESLDRNSCRVKRVIYKFREYSWALVSCFRSFDNCEVDSRVVPGLYMRYEIDRKYVDDGSWIEYDKKIRAHILGLRVKQKVSVQAELPSVSL